MSDDSSTGKYDLARKLFAILSEEGGMAVVKLSFLQRPIILRIGVESLVEANRPDGTWMAYAIPPAQIESVKPYREPWHVSGKVRNLFDLAKLLDGAPEGAQIQISLKEVT